MLKIDKVHKSYGSHTVLKGIDLEFEREEISAFLGPNGAGKTTTFNIISGVEAPDGGSIYLDTEDISELPVHLRARRGITYLTQASSLFRGLTVKENIEIYLEGTDSSEVRKHQPQPLERLNVSSLSGRQVTNLSAGQRRKVEIARALVLSPVYLLLDEPFSDLDPRSVSEIKDVLVSLKREEDIGVVISDHRADEALSIADYNYLLNEGIIIAEGTSAEIVESEAAKEAYFVEK